ncbi:unnamed protein product [Mytilus edulis]|uniref:Uncharacterized protein n=1 Tax=Mytilus edulis TaxID=6550 RepID=A0A8S3QUF1_MYTED|nr:unnamed protein product [Mytilus edulis]
MYQDPADMTTFDNDRSPTLDQDIDDTRAQTTGLPAPVRERYINATPSGEVQVRVKTKPTKPSHVRSSLSDIGLSGLRSGHSESEKERFGGAEFSRNRNDSAFDRSAAFIADNQRLSHGRRDISSEIGPNDSKFTSGAGPADTQAFVQRHLNISHDPISLAMPSRATTREERVTPWKIRTDTRAPDSFGNQEREFPDVMSGFEDNFLGRCDNQVGRQRSVLTDRRRADDNMTSLPTNRYINSASTTQKYKNPTNYDGESSWQDYQVHFEMVSEMNGWDDTTKALELATSLRALPKQY